MLLLLSESWLLVGLRGLAFLAFGLAVAYSGAESGEALTRLIGLLALADGAIHLILGARFRPLVAGWWLEALRGAVAVVLGAVILRWPALVAGDLLTWLLAGTALATLLELAVGLGLRNPLGPERLFLLTGGSFALLAALLCGTPSHSALSTVGLLRGASILVGIVQAAIAIRLRTLTRRSGSSRRHLVRQIQEQRLAAPR